MARVTKRLTNQKSASWDDRLTTDRETWWFRWGPKVTNWTIPSCKGKPSFGSTLASAVWMRSTCSLEVNLLYLKDMGFNLNLAPKHLPSGHMKLAIISLGYNSMLLYCVAQIAPLLTFCWFLCPWAHPINVRFLFLICGTCTFLPTDLESSISSRIPNSSFWRMLLEPSECQAYLLILGCHYF
jgi:hypothetical protein